jgi:shikimate dehydrogenase
MAGTPAQDGLAVDVSALGAGQAVVDLVYRPALTPLLRAAAAAGAVTVGGIGMLVHQAAHAFRLWTGEEPPISAMREAAETAQ